LVNFSEGDYNICYICDVVILPFIMEPGSSVGLAIRLLDVELTHRGSIVKSYISKIHICYRRSIPLGRVECALKFVVLITRCVSTLLVLELAAERYRTCF
jgi:hypothetical protein